MLNTFKYQVSCTDGKISVRILLITYFSTVVPCTSCVFFPVGLLSLTWHFLTVPVVPSVSLMTEGTKRPVENVVLTMKGLQERKHTCEWDEGGKIGN